MKKKYIILIMFTFIAVLFLLLPSNSGTSAEKAGASIHLRGSGTIMGLLQYGAEEYMSENPDIVVSVSGGGTDRGIKSLINGTSQIAMASSEPNAELLLLAKEKDVTLIKHIIAYDAIVPFVNLDNPVSDLSIEQLKEIYTSQITNWKDVSGKDLPISLTTRNLTSGTYEGWKHLVIGEKAVISPLALPMESKPMKAFIVKNNNAIGYCAFNYIDNTVKPLSVNGIAVNSKSVRNGEYPLKRELILYTREDASAETKKFIDYIKGITPKFAEKSGVFSIN